MPEQQDFALRAVHEWGATLPSLLATADELSALIRLSRVAAIQNRIDEDALRAFVQDGILGSYDFRTLALLRRSDDGLTNSQLLAQLGGSKAGTSARMERLNSHGIILRVRSERDRRSHSNVLTIHGCQLADRVVTEVVGARQQLIATLTPERTALLAETLAEMIDAIDPGG